MRTLAIIILLSLYSGCFITAQNNVGVTNDSVQKTITQIKWERVDTLVRFTRKQFYRNNFDKTIEIGEQARVLAKEVEDYKSYFRLSSLLGNAFLKIEDTLQAKKIFSKAVEEAEQIQMARMAIDTISEDLKYIDARSVITAEIDLGNFYALQEKEKPAIAIYKKALPLAQTLADTTHLYILNYNIAELNLNAERKTDAQYFLDQTKRYVTDQTAKPYVAGVNLLEGRLAHSNNNPKKAITFLSKSIQLFEESGYTEGVIQGNEYLAEAYEKANDYKTAYNLIKKTDSLKAEKYKTDKIQAIETVTAKFKLDQYKQELSAQELQNEFNKEAARKETTILWIKIASGILLAAAIILFISYRKRRKLFFDVIDKNKKYLAAKERSEELAEARNVLFSNITHELRTPMYGIIGISSILMKDENLKGHNENLNSLKFSANYLLSLINNVLQLTNVGSQSQESLKKSKFNLHALIENITKTSRFINTDNPNKYIVSIDEKIPKQLVGDDVKLSQILINLLSNASKFTNDGTIKVTVTEVDRTSEKIALQFEIEDDGIGISEEKKQYIFDAFSRANTREAKQGTGLGLPIVKKLLDLHQSVIHLESTLGKGTKVGFLINYDLAPSTSKGTSLQSAPTKSALKDKTILVVDDNRINQLVTKKILEIYSAKTIVAGSGAEAIEITKRETLDLILMDINMPEMNGFEATEAIREFNDSIPILALTAVELEKITGEHAHSLMNDFIIKPYTNEIFIAILQKHLKL